MPRLEFYRMEQVEFEPAYKKTLSVKEAEFVFSKLKRHFKIRQLLVWKRMRGASGRCGDWQISLHPEQTSYGILAHEVAHAIDFKKRRSKHDRKLKRIIKRVLAYCEKKGFWTGEMQRRLVAKAPKPEPTAGEKIQAEVLKLTNKKKRFESKLKFYSNKLKKTERRLKFLERKLPQALVFGVVNVNSNRNGEDGSQEDEPRACNGAV